ncbi:hypothetical protein TRVL_05484 [Trypanosoma vivax]|uniref:Secreted protein n=1 Tax=Trypanosoma vivax (strain Y486) TaxID=1055687 RepID=G0TUP4_TRYVY|nr:hypothetical protein TRVL_05484 [Trypanosoma vivax]CCC47679.1 conserved hypothetical protein [Trypanosoma vivax Y486]
MAHFLHFVSMYGSLCISWSSVALSSSSSMWLHWLQNGRASCGCSMIKCNTATGKSHTTTQPLSCSLCEFIAVVFAAVMMHLIYESVHLRCSSSERLVETNLAFSLFTDQSSLTFCLTYCRAS